MRILHQTAVPSCPNWATSAAHTITDEERRYRCPNRTAPFSDLRRAATTPPWIPRAGAGGLPPRPRWCSSAGPVGRLADGRATDADSAVGERRRRGRAGPGVRVCTLRLRTLRRRRPDLARRPQRCRGAGRPRRHLPAIEGAGIFGHGGERPDGMEPGENVQIAGWRPRMCNALDRQGSGPPANNTPERPTQRSHSASRNQAVARIRYQSSGGFPCGFLLLW